MINGDDKSRFKLTGEESIAIAEIMEKFMYDEKRFHVWGYERIENFIKVICRMQYFEKEIFLWKKFGLLFGESVMAF